jgi:hypothetical protein
MTSIKEKPPAAVGAATDEKGTFARSPYTYDYTSERQFCQALLVQIIELADDIIGDEASDAEIAGFAGMIKGLATAMREVLT